MKNYEEVTALLLQRRDAYTAKKKRQRVRLARTGVVLSCCALVAALGLQTLPGGNVPLPNYGEHWTDNDRDPNVPDQPDGSGGADADQQGGTAGDPDDDFAMGTWQGKTVTGQLLEWLPNAEATDVLPMVWAKPGIDMTYVYKGKTLQQYWDASEEERALPEQLASLYKLGDELKYGEALYTTGTPDGKKWAEALYRETVAYIGQELLDQYIVEGEFQKDALWDVLENKTFAHAAQAEWSDALEAYRADALDKAKGVLLQQGLEAYNPGNYIGIGNITKARFEAIDTEYFAGWTFGMGDAPDAPQDMTDPDDVNADAPVHDAEIGVGFDDATRSDRP